ncbi:MAG: hypothetical protein JWP00_3031 [Chloroflexi bacterium]|jgi:beta-fructofuranosidase|nr:hypothetical protein [Chloroflexota bacterium]
MTDLNTLNSNPGVNPKDPHRPVYHFLPEANWLNDPNGLIHWQGMYHVFYQYNPNGPYHGTLHWGHAVSKDLLKWQHLPVALAPTPNSPDQDGCFSGCAVDNNGVATLIYTGVRGEDQLPCVATSTDDMLVTWQKYPGNPVIPNTPQDLDLVAYRDHSVWREDNTWYQLIGAGIQQVGGTALLYRSPDLLNWEYLHPILVGDRTSTHPLPTTGDMWECPALFPLDDSHVLIISVWSNHNLIYSAYFTGDFTGWRFTPVHQAVLDNGGSFYAPQTLLDDQGRRLMWGWLQEQRSDAAQRASGWSGVLTMPRRLSILPDGRLGQAPVPELQKLRGRHQQYKGLEIPAGYELVLPEVQGDCLEILLKLAPGAASQAGLWVRCSPDGTERTLIAYDREAGGLIIDREKSSLDREAVHDRRITPFQPADQEDLTLHIFLDRSVIEVFLNNELAMASRIYPTRPDSLGLCLAAVGSQARINSMDVWTIQAPE